MKKNLQTKFSARQYMMSEDFEIYYYNEHYVSKVESHVHDYFEVYFFLEGGVSIEIEKERYPLRYGDVILIPPGVRHRALIHDKEKPYRRFVLWTSNAYGSRLLEASSAYGYLMQQVQTDRHYIFHNDIITFNSIQTKVLHLLEEIQGNRFGKEAKVELCVKDLLLHMNRIFYEQQQQGSREEKQNLHESLIDYIEGHLNEELSLERLAKEFYVSKYHIAHIFKENIGISIHQYITKKRVASCRDAIRNNLKITEAYLMFGFRDYTSFYRAFRREYGISPKEYREFEKNILEEHTGCHVLTAEQGFYTKNNKIASDAMEKEINI